MRKHLPIRLVTRSQFQCRHSSTRSTGSHTSPGSEPRLAQSTFPWLSTLKSAQLQRLARATGIQSSGTKSVLVQRIETELRTHAALSSDETSREGEWRILSIDMGIRNLAFAHLVTTSPLARTSLKAGGARDCVSTSELSAWRRLDVSNMETLDLSSSSGGSRSKTTRSTTTDSESESEKESKIHGTVSDTDAFAPHLYAAKAYTLISTLLATYKPTHILIERQRFRSGGGSAVQEWTLRVGVFEGMLYAILHALSAERGGIAVRVNGVEPKRVVGYWEMNQGSSEAEKKKLSAREVKKVKIDTVGRWLDSAVSETEGEDRGLSTERNGSSVGLGAGVSVCEDQVVRDLLDAYLRKWKGERSKKKVAGKETQEIGKLDDLADCLLQGVTWLEWQVMRERLIHEGIEALDGV